jgi:hypothetical protein
VVARSHLLQIAPIAGELRREFAAGMRLERLGVIDFARTIRLPDGDFKGDTYEPSRHPAQLCLLQAIETGATWVAVAKPVQDGGSLSTTVPILRRVVQLHQIVMVAYPTQAKAQDAWTTKLWPMLEAQGGMQPKSGGGSRGGAARVVTLPGGGQFLSRSAGGRGESGQAGDTADALDIEEVDDWSDMRRLRLIERRISKSPDPLLLYVSTVKRDGIGAGGSLILRLVELGTGTTLRYPCPHCGTIQRFEWEQVDVEREVIRCAHCPGVLDETQRQQALKHWHRHDSRRTPLFSITWTALDSPFPIVVNGTRLPVLPGLCAEYKQALDAVAIGDHGLMRQFYRDRLTRSYTADLQTDEDAPQVLTRLGLASRSMASTYALNPLRSQRDEDGDSLHLCHLPPGIEFVTAGIDVQRGGERAPGRLYFTLDGERADGTAMLIGWGSVRLCGIGAQPSLSELHAGLSRLDQILKDLEWPIVARWVDAADRQDDITKWTKLHRDWQPIRGRDQRMKPEPGDVAGVVYFRRQDGGWKLALIDVDPIRGGVHDALSLPVVEAGALLLPRGLDAGTAIVRHLVGTMRINHKRDGLRWSESAKDRQQHPEWQRRVDYLHCLTYARAAATWWRRKNMRSSGEKTDTKPSAPPPSGGFMDGYEVGL